MVADEHSTSTSVVRYKRCYTSAQTQALGFWRRGALRDPGSPVAPRDPGRRSMALLFFSLVYLLVGCLLWRGARVGALVRGA